MTQRPAFLTDASSAHRATLDVHPDSDRFEGTIDLGCLPDELRQLFTEFEEIVEGQTLSLLDQIEGRIRAAGFRLIWTDGGSTPAEDLQVFPSTGSISFRATPPAGTSLNGQATAGRPAPSVT